MSMALIPQLMALGLTCIKFLILYFVIKLAVKKSIQEAQDK
ncbi:MULTISPECIES: hypothetical protein [Clostridium]|nr:hypothetical protein [Clostridium sp. ATCC 25772]